MTIDEIYVFCSVTLQMDMYNRVRRKTSTLSTSRFAFNVSISKFKWFTWNKSYPTPFIWKMTHYFYHSFRIATQNFLVFAQRNWFEWSTKAVSIVSIELIPSLGFLQWVTYDSIEFPHTTHTYSLYVNFKIYMLSFTLFVFFARLRLMT